MAALSFHVLCSVCTRLHASGSLDNPVPSRLSLSNPPLQPSSYLAHQPATPAVRDGRPLSLSRIISKYNHRLCRVHTGLLHTYICMCVCIRVYARARIYGCRSFMYVHTESCPSRGPRAIFSHYIYSPPLPLVYDANRQA